MEEKEIIKYLDQIVERIKDFNSFGVGVILAEILGASSEISKNPEKFNNIVLEVGLFGENNDLFEKVGSWSFFKLTTKGKELKKSKLGFINFSKKTKPKKFDLYKIVPIILTVVFGISTFYFAFVNYRLKLQESKVPSLELKVDSLKKELNRINNKMIENKGKPLNKTLDTKKESE
ncbi:hypothetical protein [Polaribacter vadi]|uniref:hypothetical protein n=1 Tax=Polaribacter vadi TaxID=1774273 RepID=UPI0030ED23EF|tara:strand:- start:3170 stop:3697 length:528 start_codon:yes stop_codon:yes gene_type:complete